MKRLNELAPKTQLTQKVEGEPYENRYYHRNFTRTGGIEQAGKIFKEIGLDFTFDAIESLNSVIHKSIKNRKISPNDTLALRIIYLVIQKAAKKMDDAYP